MKPPGIGPQYNCDYCTASCTFEAMTMCQLPNEFCPTLRALESGAISDNGGFEFTWNDLAKEQS